jgi:hypothetical protein
VTAQTELWPSRIDARFKAYHKTHPGVFRLFVAFAEQARGAGRKRIGAKAIAERIRWECAVQTKDDSFKLNNVYVSRYARLVAQERPDLADLFETRRLKS